MTQRSRLGNQELENTARPSIVTIKPKKHNKNIHCYVGAEEKPLLSAMIWKKQKYLEFRTSVLKYTLIPDISKKSCNQPDLQQR